MMELVGGQIKELRVMEDKTALQMTAIIGVIALAIAALIIDGVVGESIAVTVAGFLGVIVGYIFPKSGGAAAAQCEGEKS